MAVNGTTGRVVTTIGQKLLREVGLSTQERGKAVYHCGDCQYAEAAPPGSSMVCPKCNPQPADPHRWDRIFLSQARHIARECSKDPSTKAGAVIVHPDRTFASAGYNGFARKVKDDAARYADRDLKLQLVVHAEVNAIIFARRDLSGCTLYTWPFMCCSNCAAAVINAGIVRCVAPPMPSDKEARWGENMRLAAMQFQEAGVELCIVSLEDS